jgi:hypothetical protein
MKNRELFILLTLTINCLDINTKKDIKINESKFIENYLKTDKNKKLEQIKNYIELIKFSKKNQINIKKAKSYYCFLQYLLKFQKYYQQKKSKNEVFYLAFKGLVILERLLNEY